MAAAPAAKRFQVSHTAAARWFRYRHQGRGGSGSGIADIVYMGDVVNAAAKLAAKGSNGYRVPPMMIDDVFADNLNGDNTKLVEKDWARECYTANAVNVAMEEWYEENCQ